MKPVTCAGRHIGGLKATVPFQRGLRRGRSVLGSTTAPGRGRSKGRTMKNVTAIAASAGMVIVAAFGSGALLLWNTSATAAPATTPAAPTEIVVEYIDTSNQAEALVGGVAADKDQAMSLEPAIENEAEDDEYGHDEDHEKGEHGEEHDDYERGEDDD